MNQQTLCQRPHKSCGAPYVGVLIGCQQFQRHLRSLWFGDDRQDLHLRQIGSGPAVHPLMSRSWRSLGCYSCKGHVKVMEVWMLFGYTSRWIHKFFFFFNVLLFFFFFQIIYSTRWTCEGLPSDTVRFWRCVFQNESSLDCGCEYAKSIHMPILE